MLLPAPFQFGILQFQSLARHILRGDLKLNMGGADLVEALVHDVMREFGAIAFAAQVGEVKVAQFAGHDIGGGLGGGFVGKMAVPAENALLEAPWPARNPAASSRRD